MRLIPTSITQKGVDPNNPTGGMTLDALMARQRMLQQAKPEAPAQIASPWQGAALMANTFVNSLQQRQAQEQETAGRNQLAQTISGINPMTGATPEQEAMLMKLDPDTGMRYIADAMQATRQRAATAAENSEWDRRNAINTKEELAKQAANQEHWIDQPDGSQVSSKTGEHRSAPSPKEPQGFGPEQDLRKEYSALPLIKNFPVVQTGIERMQSGAADNSPVGDIALIYGFMKLQDPESVVREGEYATAQNAAGIPDRVANLYNQAIKGVRLTPEQRAEFLRNGGAQYQNITKQIGDVNARYSTIAKNYNIDPNRVLMTPKAYDQIGGQAPQQPEPPPPPQPQSPNDTTPAPVAAEPVPKDLTTLVKGKSYTDETGQTATYNGGDPNSGTSWTLVKPVKGAQ